MMSRRIARWAFPTITIFILSAAAGAFAQSVDFRGACGEDMQRLCPGVQPGQGRIVACLSSYPAQLSAACRYELASVQAGRGGSPGGYAPNPYGPNAYGPPNTNAYGPNDYRPGAYGPNGYGPAPNANGYGPNPYGPNPYNPGVNGGGGYGQNPYGPPANQYAYGTRRSTSAPPSTAGDSRGSIVTRDGRTRTYIVHLPTGYTAGKSYPLVLLFHGGAGNGSRILSSTRFAAKADQEGFIVVAPDGIDGHWNDGRGTTNPDVDDVGFVRQLIADLKPRLRIDPKRIYATGLSNGGIFTQRLGCELSDTLAAIGPDVGPIAANLLSSCKPGPIAVVGIQGGADPGIPINGGEMGDGGFGRGGVAASAAQTMKLWATASGCSPTPTVTNLPPKVRDGTQVVKYSYSGCAAGTSVDYYIVQGMGHGWPPTEGVFAFRNGPISHNINATDVMWDFFNTHSRL
jgi:polyhydroxybutyrate depolymerase